jgi:hypothetical protein
MCTDNPELPKEANKAKCFVISCFVFSIFSMIGFFGGWSGIVGAIGGILACIASSILMCCAPKSPSEGGGKFTGAAVLLLIGGILQLIMAIVTVILMAMILTAVNEDYCGARYKDCDSSMNCFGTTICYQEVDDATVSNDNSCWSGIGDGECDDGGIGSIYSSCMCGTDLTDCGERSANECAARCSSEGEKKLCEDIHGAGTAVVSAVVGIVMGIATAFLLIAGILNTIGGAYCLKAKTAMANAQTSQPAAATAVPVDLTAGGNIVAKA